MRIVSGQWGGRVIAAPKGDQTRPTSEKARAAIFNALDARMDWEGVTVYDLYAGSGAMGLEAASRGASQVVMVERAGAACGVIKANMATLKANPAQCQYVCAKVEAWLPNHPPPPGAVVFLDPPYALWADGQLLMGLLGGMMLPAGVWVVAEMDTRAAPAVPAGLEVVMVKRYGETQVMFLVSAPPSSSF